MKNSHHCTSGNWGQVIGVRFQLNLHTDAAALHFDARYLALPLKRDEAAINQMLQRDRLLVPRVRQLLASQPVHTLTEGLAAQLHLSPHTLHRQLKDEGASLQALEDEVRRNQAFALLLQRRHQPLKQVATAAGFKNEKSFIRAFKGWTGGVTPGEWRGSR